MYVRRVLVRPHVHRMGVVKGVGNEISSTCNYLSVQKMLCPGSSFFCETMSSQAARKRVFKLVCTDHSAFTQVSAMCKHPRIHQDPPECLSTLPAPSRPLFTLTHTLRESLPAEVSEPQSPTVLPATDDPHLYADPHIPDDEEFPLRTPASRKVPFPMSCARSFLTHVCRGRMK
jgi:hypothetical protein